MSLSGKLSRTNWYVDNWGTNPSSVPGTSVTPGASDSWGSWTTLLSALANQAYCLQIDIRDGNTSGEAKPQVMEIGADPNGGTSFTAIAGPFPMGASGGLNGVGGHHFVLPIRIPSGASIGCRIKGSHATAGTVGIMAKASGKPSGPHNIPVGAYMEVVGTITNSVGVSFTPGNAADGSWVDLGATSKHLWWWQIAYQINNVPITAEQTYIAISHGDASNKEIICRLMHMGTTAEAVGGPLRDLSPWAFYCPVPAGEHIYIWARCVNAPDTGYNGAAIGVGG